MDDNETKGELDVFGFTALAILLMAQRDNPESVFYGGPRFLEYLQEREIPIHQQDQLLAIAGTTRAIAALEAKP